ncbi:MAG: nuclear transport factor 2 family protein, partial [Gammaproteobacteria bacterium]
MPSNLDVTQAIFTAFGARDIPGILPHLDDDILIEFYGPSTIPYAGTYRGKAAARRFFETVLSSIVINEFAPEEMLAIDDKVIVTGHLNLNPVHTTGVIDSDFVHVITLRNGKWLRFRDFMNTAAAVTAFQASPRGG